MLRDFSPEASRVHQFVIVRLRMTPALFEGMTEA